jgi:Flp pilus assembly protein TadG
LSFDLPAERRIEGTERLSISRSKGLAMCLVPNRQRAGATTVEFALTAPILFMFILAGVEFGRANMIRGTLGNAAYEGAREGITPGATVDDSRNAAQMLLNATLTRHAKIDIKPAVINDETPEVTVSISVDFAKTSWIVGRFTKGLTLTNSRTLRREKYDPDIVADFSPGGSGTGSTPGPPSGGGSLTGGGGGGWGGWGSGRTWGGGWGGGGGGRGGRDYGGGGRRSGGGGGWGGGWGG